MEVLTWNAPAEGGFSPSRPEPEALRMGRIVDHSALQPGDLMLTRDENPDWVSRGIVRVQATEQMDPDHSRFTHAMLYLGAGFVLEATFEFKRPGVGLATKLRTVRLMTGLDSVRDPAQIGADPQERLHGVFITPLAHYGEHYSLRARRPKAFAGQPVRQQEMVANALSLFTLDYDFALVRALGFHRLWPSSWLRLDWSPKVCAAAVVCSTFYARAYDLTLAGVEEGLAPEEGRCTPAFLSASNAFDDVPLQWAKVG